MSIVYPTDTEARQAIIAAGRRLDARGYIAATDGNITARVSDRYVWATPSGVCKGELTEQMLVKLDLDGHIVSGGKPSSEIRLHLAVYRKSPEILGVVHAHPPVSSAFASAGIALDTALLQESVVLVGVIPVAPYAIPGSGMVAEAVAPFVGTYNGALLEHHGAVCWGRSVQEALYRMERAEHTATVEMYTRMMGIERPMTNAQIDALITLRPSWGVTGGGRPLGRC